MEIKQASIAVIGWIIACSWLGSFALLSSQLASVTAWAPPVLGSMLLAGVVELQTPRDRPALVRWVIVGWVAEAICFLAVLVYYALIAWEIVHPAGEAVSP